MTRAYDGYDETLTQSEHLLLHGKYVTRGARMLDLHGPANWRSKIDMDSFDVSCPRHCIVGQLGIGAVSTCEYGPVDVPGLPYWAKYDHRLGFSRAVGCISLQQMKDMWQREINNNDHGIEERRDT